MKKLKRLASAGTVCTAMLMASTSAMAADYSFTGTFDRDDDVQLFNFSVGLGSTVSLRTWSYAGGTNAAGQVIARGGFDPILALFNSAGAHIDQNDDGGCGFVAQDALTGMCWDTFFSADLAPGDYTVAVMQYDNFAKDFLSDGFTRDGQGNFTAGWGSCNANQFCDVSAVTPGNARANHWAFDILGVENATQSGGDPSPVPEPGTLALVGASVLGLPATRRRKQ